MVDDFMVCVDRIIASACFESVNGGGGGVRGEGSENVCAVTNSGGAGGGGEGCSKKEGGMVKGGGVVVECRICQEEDEEHAMEAPCACNGTLKVFTFSPENLCFAFIFVGFDIWVFAGLSIF